MAQSFDLHTRATTRRILRFVLIAVIIGLGVNVLLSLLVDRGQYFASLRKVRVVYFVVPLLLFIASYAVDALRTMIVVAQFRIRIHFLQAFYNSAVGSFFLNTTPMSAGGQPFQIWHMSSIGVPLDAATNLIASRFVEQAITSVIIVLLSLTQVSWIASSLRISPLLIYGALGITLAMTGILIFFLVRPLLIGRLAVGLEKTGFGRLVARLSGRHAWGRSLHRWSHRLRTSVRTLWSKKAPAMLLDTLLGAVNIVLHAWSLHYVLQGVTGTSLPLGMVIITYVILWQIVVYVPTPGASGGVEGAFTLVYAGLTGALESTIVAIFVWRLASYYLLILFGGLVYSLLGRWTREPTHRVSVLP